MKNFKLMGSGKKRALVTGATGFVGANLCRRLIRAGYDVHIITRESSDMWRLADILPSLHDYKADLREAARLAGIITRIKPNVIFHLAGSAIYDGRYLGERELIEINLLGTLNLLSACGNIDYECFIHTGSSSEYGPKLKPMKESDTCLPDTFYGISKLAATLFAQLKAKTENKPVVCLRLFSPFGPFDDARRLISYVVNQALQNKPLNLANPLAVRDYIYIEDVIDAYLLCANKAAKISGKILNIGSGRQVAIQKVVEKILLLCKSKSRVNWHTFAGRSYDAPFWQADIAKPRRLINWQPKLSFSEGLKKAVDWFKENQSSYQGG